jgi:hypothetical protein
MIDLLGRRFGKLVVVEKTSPDSMTGKSRWLCKCDCGKEHIAMQDNLKEENTKSCGCYRNTCRILPGDSGSFNEIYRQYFCNARNRKISFSLSREQFREIAENSCRYCGASPKPYYAKYRAKLPRTPCILNGIDREDNSKGYEVFNCVACCSLCNYMKRSISVEEFLSHIKRIYLNSGSS